MATPDPFAQLKSDFQTLIRGGEAYSVAAINVLCDWIRSSDGLCARLADVVYPVGPAGTLMELREQLENAMKELKKLVPEIYIKAGCEILMVSIVRPSQDVAVR